jgi:superfamily II DNA or RNA helicase
MSDEVRAEGKKLGISDKFMDKHSRIYTTTSGNEPNFESLSTQDKKLIREQIKDILEQRFTFIRYTGLTRNSIAEYTTEGMYDDSVVIIDEAHNLISRVINESEITDKLYNAIYNAKRCKVVALSGTPVINSPNEIAYMMNLLRGPIERITMPFKTIVTWDEAKITKIKKKAL